MPVVPRREPFTSGLEKGVPWEVVQTTRLKHESFFVDSSWFMIIFADSSWFMIISSWFIMIHDHFFLTHHDSWLSCVYLLINYLLLVGLGPPKHIQPSQCGVEHLLGWWLCDPIERRLSDNQRPKIEGPNWTTWQALMEAILNHLRNIYIFWKSTTPGALPSDNSIQLCKFTGPIRYHYFTPLPPELSIQNLIREGAASPKS